MHNKKVFEKLTTGLSQGPGNVVPLGPCGGIVSDGSATLLSVGVLFA